MILKIRQAGEPVLRQQARPLSAEEILDRTIQDLIESMRETMHDAPGVGLAAPQVGAPVQLAVVEDQPRFLEKLSSEQLAERERSAVPFHVLINPVIHISPVTVPPSAPEDVEFYEGCLSVAGFTAIVPRAKAVRVECLNERAEPVTIDAKGWYARILQHEIDHLHGTLYLDRMKPRSFSTQDNHARYWKDLTALSG
jgi:peptide deformylase